MSLTRRCHNADVAACRLLTRTNATCDDHLSSDVIPCLSRVSVNGDCTVSSVARCPDRYRDRTGLDDRVTCAERRATG